MDPTLPVAVPSPYKSRRGWLIAFGVIEILMGCSFLLMILFSAIAFLGPAAAKMPPNVMSPSALMFLVGLQFGLLAAVFFTGGIGSILCKNWARILMLVVSGFWLGLGLIGTLILAFQLPAIMRQQHGNLSPGMGHGFVVGMIVFMTAFMVLLPAIFLFFYSRRSVRATCLAQKAGEVPTLVAGATPALGLPIPLAFLGALQALTALSMFAVLFMPLARVAIVFGVVLHGGAAILALLTNSVLNGYAAWAVFRQRLIGWQIALFTTSFWALSTLVSYVLRPDLVQLGREMGYSDQMLRTYEQFPHLPLFVMVGLLVMMTLLLVFVLYTRKFFPSEAR
jgi:hypothetical protein